MSEEDRAKQYSISSADKITCSRSSKRQKKNKVPQRGLGVAKLEKMRLEEEQTKAALSTYYSFNHPLTFTNFHPSSQILSSFFYKSNPYWTLPYVFQTTQQHQQPSSSSMANLPSGTSSTFLPQVSMEPPLIQNNSNSYVPIRPKEKAFMIGIKRQNPFSMDVPPAPSFSFNLPTFAAPMDKNEEILCGSGVTLDHASKKSFSEFRPSYSASNFEPNSEMSNNKGKDNFNGDFDFLKLSHPDSTSSLHLKSTSYQGIKENQIPYPLEYIFIPPASNVAQTEQTRDRLQNDNVVGGVDLNLKL